MQTLTEIDAEERARRARASEFERLQNAAAQLRATVTRLEAQIVNVGALERIAHEALDVPEDLTTRATRFIPGGFNVRELLTTIVADALAVAQRKQAERDAALTKARADLANVEAALREF